MTSWPVVKQTDLADRGDHVVFQLEQPLLHLTAGLGRRDDILQLYNLTLTALDVSDVQGVCELQQGDTLKALLQMGLNPGVAEWDNDDGGGWGRGRVG